MTDAKFGCDKSEGGVVITAALSVELRSLLDHFGAKRLQKIGFPWPVYAAGNGSLIFVETGVGGYQAAAACSATAVQLQIPKHWCWLNLGIAGSGVHARGSWVLANRVLDESSGLVAFLRPPQSLGLVRDCVRTVAQPTNAHQQSGVLEMEASGFVAAARRFTSLEQIAVAKLVVDTDEDELAQINKSTMLRFCADNVSQIYPWIEYYRKYSMQEKSLVDSAVLPAELWEKWHFTAYQRAHITRLWRSFRVFYPQRLWLNEVAAERDAAAVIKWMQDALDSVVVHW